MKRGIRANGKWLLFLLFVQSNLLFFRLTSAQNPDDIMRLYQAGELDKIKSILLNRLEENEKDPEILFYLAMFEERGELSRKYLDDVMALFPDWRNSEGAGLLICKYEFSKGLHLTTVNLAGRFEKDLPLSQMLPEVLWTSGTSFLAANKPDSALLWFDKIVESFPTSSWAGWAQLCRGDCFVASKKYDSAVVEYRKVLNEYEDSEAFAFALSGLIQCFTQLEDSENALLHYNLLKERYPNFLESVGSQSKSMVSAGEGKHQTQAERVAGVSYTIQLGVFAKRENARNLRSHFEKQGYSVNVRSKIISGKKYYVVRLGSFTSYEEALELKKKLESQTKESYRIVIK